jgi:Ca-activated chloride channel family protein
LKQNGVVQSFKRDQNNEVVITKLNAESLTTIAKSTNGVYIEGAQTKVVLDKIKKTLDTIQKTEFEATQMANFESQFQWFIGLAILLLVIDMFLLERTTTWIKNLNLFNEKQ